MAEMLFLIKAMNRDLAMSKFNPEFAYEIYNMRVVATDSQTSFALTNERGTLDVFANFESGDIEGYVLGGAVLNNNLYIITHEERKTNSNLIIGKDRIYEITLDDNGYPTNVTNLVSHTDNESEVDYVKLNLDFDHPLDILPYYESEDILKLYWIDGKNQARMFNVVSRNLTFDFLPEVSTDNVIIIEKKAGGGKFPAGVIQYCFTFSVNNGLESNIFYISPLYYITRDNNFGLQPGEYANCHFEINFEKITSLYYDNINIYSLSRSTLNGEVDCRKVGSFPIADLIKTLETIITLTDNVITTNGETPKDITAASSPIIAEEIEFGLLGSDTWGIDNTSTPDENWLSYYAFNFQSRLAWLAVMFGKDTTNANAPIFNKSWFKEDESDDTPNRLIWKGPLPSNTVLLGKYTLNEITCKYGRELADAGTRNYYNLYINYNDTISVNNSLYGYINTSNISTSDRRTLISNWRNAWGNMSTDEKLEYSGVFFKDNNNENFTPAFLILYDFYSNLYITATLSDYNIKRDTKYFSFNSRRTLNLTYTIVQTSEETGFYSNAEKQFSIIPQIIYGKVQDDHNPGLETVPLSHLLITCQRQMVIPHTIANKDNTLFLGNLEVPSLTIDEDIKTALIGNNTEVNNDGVTINRNIQHKARLIADNSTTPFSMYNTNRSYGVADNFVEFGHLFKSSLDLKIFKSREYYKIAILFINARMEKSEVVDLGYTQIPPLEVRGGRIISYYPVYDLNAITITTDNESDGDSMLIINALKEAGWVGARLLILETVLSQKSIIALGIVSPTVFQYNNRLNDSPFAMSSWFFRPFGTKVTLPHNHYEPLYSSDKFGNEILCITCEKKLEELENVEYTEYIDIEITGKVKDNAFRGKDFAVIEGKIKLYKVTYDESNPLGEALSSLWKTYYFNGGRGHGQSKIAQDLNDAAEGNYKDGSNVIWDYGPWCAIIENERYNTKHGYDRKQMPVDIATLVLKTLKHYNLNDYMLGIYCTPDWWEKQLDKNFPTDSTHFDGWRNGNSRQKLKDSPFSVTYRNKKVYPVKINHENLKTSTFVDTNILTFHSPDISENNLSNFNNNVKMRILGVAEHQKSVSTQKITLDTLKHNNNCFGAGIHITNEDSANDLVATYFGYNDDFTSSINSNGWNESTFFLTHPWQRTYSLGPQHNIGHSAGISVNDLKDITNPNIEYLNAVFGKPKTKILYNRRDYSFTLNISALEYNLAGLGYVPSVGEGLTKIMGGLNSKNSYITYLGNPDFIYNFITEYNEVLQYVISVEDDKFKFNPTNKIKSSSGSYYVWGATADNLNTLIKLGSNIRLWQTGLDGSVYPTIIWPNTKNRDLDYNKSNYADLGTSDIKTTLFDVQNDNDINFVVKDPINIKYSSEEHGILSLANISTVSEETNNDTSESTAATQECSIVTLPIFKRLYSSSTSSTLDDDQTISPISKAPSIGLDTSTKHLYLTQNTNEDAYVIDVPGGYSGGAGYSSNSNEPTSNVITPVDESTSVNDLGEEPENYIYLVELYNNAFIPVPNDNNFGWIPTNNFEPLTKTITVEEDTSDTNDEKTYELLGKALSILFMDSEVKPSSLFSAAQKIITPYIVMLEKQEDSKVVNSDTEETSTTTYDEPTETKEIPRLLQAIEGDYFYNRWECLKTFATTDKDVNQIVEVVTIPVETKINLEARVDRNRGSMDGTGLSPKNFNLYNDIYNQSNNLFTYYTQDLRAVTKYSNEIIWSLSKNNTENIDSWTTITTASVLDLDGVNGSLTKLELWNDKLLAFLEKAINYIPFNARVAVEATDGVPIEIANSGKVDTPMIMTNKIGCQNKWSICGTNHYLYFIDNYNQGIYRLGGEGGFQSLSDIKGFHSWMNQNNIHGSWIPYPDNSIINNFKTSWDPINNEILFVNQENCLAFNENLDEFTSFYSYEGVPYFFTLQDLSLALTVERKTSISPQGNPQSFHSLIHVLRDSSNLTSYNNFFGEQKNYYITFIANDQPMITKIFNTLEYTADAFKYNSTTQRWDYDANNTFTTLDAVDEYLSGTTNIVSIGDKEKYPDFRKRFRVWRTDIPRDSLNESGRQDRMSNPWLKLTLTKNTDTNSEGKKDYDKLLLHNIIVSYTEL